ncbi:MAG: hypothetical protein IPH84_10095 [Bacteroidales bacterium]|nr:hypothetical protein [Bacteroidales bacterium]
MLFNLLSRKKALLAFMIIVQISALISPTSGQEKVIFYPYDASHEIQDKNIRLNHLDAHLYIKPYDTLVEGSATFTFSSLEETIDSLVFSVPEINIDSVRVNGVDVPFSMKGSDVLIFPGNIPKWSSGNTVYFRYSAKPTDGLYFVGWNDPKKTKRKQIWAHRPNHWIPYQDGIITVNMAIKVDERYKVFNNGVRQKVIKNDDHTQTWVYAMNHPHPFFSTSLVIGEYEFEGRKTNKGLPLELWYYPDWKDHVEPAYRYMPEMFDFFEEEFGLAYPWELYREAPVIDYMYGAMETTTATIFGDYLMVDERGFLGRNYVNVNAHELAHQWFGNYVSHLKGKDVWLTESFATYYAKKFEQHIFGEDYYQEVRNKELQETLDAGMKDAYPVGHSMGGRDRWYPKGSLVLDMLRDVLGDEEFKASIKLYLETFPYQTAETSDLLQCIRKATGQSLEWFFEEWILHGGEPSYQVSYEEIKNKTGQDETRIMVEQRHETGKLIGLFKMPIGFEVHYADGSISSKEQWISEKREWVSIPNPEGKKIAFVIFDPGRKIIKHVTFNRTYSELIAQLSSAENMIDRYDALLAMKEIKLETKREDLYVRFYKETSVLIRSEIVAQLASDTHPLSIEILQKAIADQNDKVRLAVLKNLKSVPAELKAGLEKCLTDPSYLNVELALELLCRSFPSEQSRYLSLTKNEEGWRGKNIRMKWLEISSERSKKHLNELVGYSSESYEFETRINAMNVLKKLNYCNDEVILNLGSGLIHWNYKIRNASLDCLKYFNAQSAYHSRIDQLLSNHTNPDIQVAYKELVTQK